MKAFIFPGQGCQKEGMGKELFEQYPASRTYFERADACFGRSITEVMFHGSELDLMETQNTQPAVFIYEVAAAMTQKSVRPDVVAGHSLGEFAALVVSGCLSFEDGLNLVLHRAIYGQEACDKTPTAMGAVIGLSDEYVERRIREIWDETGEPVYFANYNGPGQVVITGSKMGIRTALKHFKEEGAKKAVLLGIGGSFHSPYMAEAREKLGAIIEKTTFNEPICPIYQCVDGKPHTNPDELKANLIDHITHPVLWTSMVRNMHADGVDTYYEVGTDDTLQKIVARMCPESQVGSIWDLEDYNNLKDNTL